MMVEFARYPRDTSAVEGPQVLAVAMSSEDGEPIEYAANVYQGDEIVMEHQCNPNLYPGGLEDFAAHTMKLYVTAMQCRVNALQTQVDAIHHEAKKVREAIKQPKPKPRVDKIHELAEIIRTVDGNHSLGAAALAEAILDEQARRD